MESNTYQRFTREVIVIGIMTLLVSLSDLILLSLLTKTLGAQGYGLWAQVRATIYLAVPLASLGLPYAMVRFLAAKKDKEEIQEGFYSIVSIVVFNNLIISSILIIFPDPIANYFFDGASQIVRLTGFIILAFALNGVYMAFFRTFRRIKAYAVFNIVRAYAEIGLVAYLVLNGYGILGAVWSLLIIRATLFLVLFFFVRARIGIKRPNFSRMKEYLHFSMPSIAGSIAGWVVALSDRYVIGYFLGAASVGIYAAGYMIGSAATLFTGVLGFVLPAALSQLYDEDRIDEVKTHLKYSLKYSLAFLIPLVFGAAVLAEPVLRLFSTPEIASQGYFIIPIVALGFLLVSISDVIGYPLILVKKTKIIAGIWMLAAAVNLGLNILIIPLIGILGAAITTLVAYLLAALITVYYSSKELKFDIDWHFIAKSLIASAIMSLIVWWIAQSGNMPVIITVVIGVSVYAALLFLLRGFTKEEIRFFREILRMRSKEN